MRLTVKEKAFLRYLEAGCTVDVASYRIGRCPRTGWRMLAAMRACAALATAEQS